MLLKLNSIIVYLLASFFLALALYPIYINFLKKIKAGKTIREDSVTGDKAVIFAELHQHKAGTPTMGGGLFLVIMLIMVGLSSVLQRFNFINNDLIAREETYILLFSFFSMGLLGFLDDYFNIQGKGKIKGLSANFKLMVMFGFAAFVSYRFYVRLGIDTINFWPFAGNISLGPIFPVFVFFFTVGIVNAINITDGLDGLAGGLLSNVLGVLALFTFFYGRYLATTLIGIVLGTLAAFLWFNINPARIFMGDSGAFAVGGLIASLFYLLNIKVGIFVPFMILFALFWVELLSSFLQIMSKKYRGKKLFPIAPLHHLFEHRGNAEHTIVMKFWVVQGILAAFCLVMIFYQLHK